MQHQRAGDLPKASIESDPVWQKQLEGFVVGILKAFGCKVECRQNAWFVRLSDSLQEQLQCSELCLVFQRSQLDEMSEAVYLTAGSPVLDRLLLLATRIPVVANLAVLGSEYWQQGPPQQLPLTRGKSRLLSYRPAHHRLVLFFFKVSFCADETRETLIPVAVDAVTERVCSFPSLKQAVSVGHLGVLGQRSGQAPADFQCQGISGPWDPKQKDRGRNQWLSGSGRWGTLELSEISEELESLEVHTAGLNPPTISYTLSRAYQVACRAVEHEARKRAEPFLKGLRSRYKNEQQRLERYYRGRREEALEPLRQLFKRLAGLKVRLDMVRSYTAENRYLEQMDRLRWEVRAAEARYERELSALDEERQWRMAELEAKYSMKVVARLVSAANLWVPRLECSYAVGPAAEAAAHRVQTAYDLMSGEFADLLCEHCQAKPVHFVVCDNGDLACSYCSGPCGGCGTHLCGECAAGSCHLCGDHLCEECLIPCPYFSHLSVCPSCAAQWCSVCGALFQV